jgi:hypothetical protein
MASAIFCSVLTKVMPDSRVKAIRDGPSRIANLDLRIKW